MESSVGFIYATIILVYLIFFIVITCLVRTINSLSGKYFQELNSKQDLLEELRKLNRTFIEISSTLRYQSDLTKYQCDLEKEWYSKNKKKD